VVGCRGNKADAPIGKNGFKAFRNKFAAIITLAVFRVWAVVVMYDFKPYFELFWDLGFGLHWGDKCEHGRVIPERDCELETVYVWVKKTHNVGEKQVEGGIFWNNGGGEKTVSGGFGKDTFFTEERLPFGT
jgi:hypothetical protein